MADEDGPAVFLVDDDDDVRIALDALLRSCGFRVEAFASVAAFKASGSFPAPGCLLLDVRLPGQSGISFQAELAEQGIELPVILMSGHADAASASRALELGAIAFLIKPVPPEELIDAVRTGLARFGRE
ncbi:response regulator transcription factor [Acuticoccus yangtzensis]|uniref:response regulator transcription factor n=1 Tax=Acuticoccus yangtzensis TaxID=1443441 RepID=UPI00094960C9|nr:response regulator [Acuticoccus yangtzensis]